MVYNPAFNSNTLFARHVVTEIDGVAAAAPGYGRAGAMGMSNGTIAEVSKMVVVAGAAQGYGGAGAGAGATGRPGRPRTYPTARPRRSARWPACSVVDVRGGLLRNRRKGQGIMRDGK